LLRPPITIVATTGNIFFKISAPMPVCSAARPATAHLTSLLPKT
jgi:hypothetical protein